MEENFEGLDVLICCYFFNGYTGSEMSNFEMAKQLKKWGHNVTIIAEAVGNPLKSKAESFGIRVFSVNEMPDENFDILHLNHKPIAEKVLKKYSKTPAVMHVRSEVIPHFEEPIKSPQIKKYISIRDTVKDHIMSFGIPDNKIIHIDNPFDYERFNTDYESVENNSKIVLFVGTIDHLRINMIYEAIKNTERLGGKFWIIGKDQGNYLPHLKKFDCVEYLGIKENVEDYIKKSDVTVGIFRGRTTIEGWLCGKPAYIYYVDNKGNILDMEYQEVPDDVDKYRSDISIEKVEDLYYDILEIK